MFGFSPPHGILSKSKPTLLKQFLGAVGNCISNCPSCGVNAIKQKDMSIEIHLALAFKHYQLFSTNFYP